VTGLATGGAGAAPEVTEDGFLDGCVRLRQPAEGYRAAIDPVFLAAAVPAGEGERALDIGAGVGAAALLLAWRVPGLRVSGLEIDSALLRLAVDNARLNGMEARVEFMLGDLARPPARLAPGSFHHVLANPPYLEAARADPATDEKRAAATVEGEAGLAAWLRFGCMMARDNGTVTMIHRADRLDELLAVLRGRAGGITVFPLWPDRGNGAAKRVLVQARKGARTPMRLAQGLALHESDGRFTAEADAILRAGRALAL
jgi:tRNA1(Val) A37 N6-methylase TrmN6